MALEGGTFTYNNDLSRFVDRHMSPDVTETAVFKTAALEYLWKNRKTTTGERVEWAQLTTDSSDGANIFFNIDGTGDGVTAAEVDNHHVCQADWANAGRKIRLSKIKIQRAAGKEARVDYVKRSTRSEVIALMQGINRNIFVGDGDASGARDLIGLDNIIDYTGSYAQVTRSTSRALVGNKISATSTATSLITQTGTSVTNGSASVTLGGNQTWADGDIVVITDDSGFKRWYYANGAGAATTALTLSSVYEGETDATVTAEIYSVFNDTTEYGASGVLTLDKVHKAYSLAIDGSDAPNLALCHNFQWNKLRQLVLDTERSISRSDLNRLGTSGHTNFLFLDMPVVIDNNAAMDKIYMANMDYLELCTLQGFGDMSLSKDGLKDLVTENNDYATLIGEVVVSAVLKSTGNNRHSVLTDLNV